MTTAPLRRLSLLALTLLTPLAATAQPGPTVLPEGPGGAGVPIGTGDPELDESMLIEVLSDGGQTNPEGTGEGTGGAATNALPAPEDFDISPCGNDLSLVDEALDDEDAGRAGIMLEMAVGSCRTLREAVVAHVGEEPYDAADEPYILAMWGIELMRANLAVRASRCDEARDTLRVAAAAFPLPDAIRNEFTDTALTSLACGTSTAVAAGGTVTAGPGLPEVYLSGVTRGVEPASARSSYCSGSIPAAPSYTLEVTGETNLYISASSGDDLVMLIEGPDGQIYCNDDYDGLNPGIAQYFSAGTYQVYIGEYSSYGYDVSYSFYVGEGSGPIGGYGTYVYPTYGSASIGSSYPRTTLSGSTWGVNDASVTLDPSCAGWIAEMPDFQVYVDAYSDAWVSVTGPVGSDLTLVIDGPSGRTCVDDGTDANPTFNGTLAAGTYNVWVGDKSGPSSGLSYGIQFSSYDPMTVLDTAPSSGDVTISTASPLQTVAGTSETRVPAGDFFGTTCYGTIPTAPSYRLIVPEGAMVEAIARTTDSSDLVMVVTGPAGTFCNDDYSGLDPGVRRWLTAGEYSVFVGTLGSGSRTIGFNTTFSIQPGDPPVDLSGLTTGRAGRIEVSSTTAAETFSGTSGGSKSAADFDATCRGWVNEEPDVLLDITTATYLSFQVMSPGDTTLVVSGPDGVFCNDDYTGVNPQIDQYLSAGRYGVWVGSYNQTESHPFMISVRNSYY